MVLGPPARDMKRPGAVRLSPNRRPSPTVPTSGEALTRGPHPGRRDRAEPLAGPTRATSVPVEGLLPMRRFLALLAALLLALTVALPVSATEPIGPVYPFHPDQYDGTTVDVGQTLLLGAHWGGCVPGLVTEFGKASVLVWTIDGNPVAAPAAWTRAIAVQQNPHPRVPGGPDMSACVSQVAARTAPYRYWAFWQYPVVFTAGGVHVIRLVGTANHPWLDGGDYDGDGRPDMFGRDWISDSSITTHVVPAS